MTSTLHPESVQRLMREIQAMAQGGLPLNEGLGALAKSGSGGTVARAARQVVAGLEMGMPLSKALAESNPPLPPTTVALIKCAETSGDVAPLAQTAAESARRTLQTRAALENLTAYPCAVLATSLLIYAFMTVSIMPKNWRLMESLNIEPSTLTYLVYYPAMAGGEGNVGTLCSLTALALFAMMVVPPLRQGLWRIGSLLPGVGALARMADFSNLLATVAALTGRGVPLHDALEATAPSLTTAPARAAAMAMADAARRGQPIHPHVPGDLPATVALVLNQAERSPKFPEALDSLATWCGESFLLHERRALARLEPVLLIIVGIVVALLLHAAYGPVVNSIVRTGEKWF